MESAGLPVGDADIIDAMLGEPGLMQYFSEKRGHTAIICEHEGLAGEFIRLAPKIGLCVPDDLSIVGIDSTGFCNELRPSLTAVNQPLSKMGERAAELLVQAMQPGDHRTEEVVFPCGFDVRESTSPAK